MKTFKQFLTEQHYGSLVDPDVYQNLDTADKLLYKYTADAFTSIGSKIKTLVDRYPYGGGTIYRGLHFSNQKQHDAFMADVESGELTISGTSSWTPSLLTAQDFAHSKKSYFPTPELMHAAEKMRTSGDHMTGYGGVVIMTKVAKNIGVDVSKSEFAKESEVILPPGTYSVKVQELTEPFSRKYDTPEKVSAFIDELRNAKKRSPELDKKANYIRKTWAKKLHPAEVDVLMKYSSGAFLAASASTIASNSVRFSVSKYFKDDPYRLELDVSSGIDEELYDMCSAPMQAVINKKLKLVVKALASAIKQIANHENANEIEDFKIYNVRRLMRFLPDETAAAVLPLRKLLGAKYHSLNSRENTKMLTTNDQINKRGETIESVVRAMSQL